MSTGDLENQLSIQQQINDAIRDRNQLLAEAAQLQATQAELAIRFFGEAGEDREGQLETLGRINTNLDQVIQRTARISQATQQATGQQGRFAEALGKVNKKTVVLGATGVGVFSGLRGFVANLKNGMDGLLSSITAVGAGLFELGKAVVLAPFKLVSGLIDLALRGGGGGRPIAQAYEEIRGVFGKLSRGEGKAVIDTIRGLRKENGKLAAVGRSIRTIYGRGRQGVAEMMKDVNKVAQEMGASFRGVAKEFKKSPAEMLLYTKGLALTGEEMGKYTKRAKVFGTTVEEQLKSTAKLSVQLGDRFDISARLISNDMKEMTADFANFGHVGNDVLASTSVYARQLGIEIKDMMGVIDKFDNFESAAEGASMLAQSFGMNVDAMAMMKAESPAQMIDMLRQSFFETGRSIKDLSRQEKKLLEQQTGLEGSALAAAFANENMGMSYEDIAAASEDAAENQISDAQALKEMADAITKTIESGGGGGGGLLDRFFRGLKRSFLNQKEMRLLFDNIQATAVEFEKFGQEMGDILFEFPGVRDFICALADLFDPGPIRDMLNDFKEAFKKFFKDLEKDPAMAGENLFKNIMGEEVKDKDGKVIEPAKGVTKFLDKKGPTFQKIKDSFKAFFLGIANVIVALAPIIMDGFIAVFTMIGDVFNPEKDKKEGKAAEEAGESMTSKLRKSLDQGIEKVKEKWPCLRDAFLYMIEQAFDVKTEGGVLSTIGGFFASFVGKGLIVLLVNTLLGNVVGSLLSGVLGIGSGTGGLLFSILKGVLVGGVAFFTGSKIVQATKDGVKRMRKKIPEVMGDEFVKGAGEKGLARTAKFASFLDAITFGALPDDTAIKVSAWLLNKKEEILKAARDIFSEDSFLGKLFPKGTGKKLSGFLGSGFELAEAYGMDDSTPKAKKAREAAIAKAQGNFKKAACDLKCAFLGVFDGLMDKIFGVMGFGDDKKGIKPFQDFKNRVKKIFCDLKCAVLGAFAGIAGAVMGAFGMKPGEGGGFSLDFSGTIDKVMGTLEKAGSLIEGIGKSIKDTVTELFGDGKANKGTATTGADSFFKTVNGHLGEGGLTKALTKVKDAATAIKDAMLTFASDNVNKKITTFTSSISRLFGPEVKPGQTPLDASLNEVERKLNEVTSPGGAKEKSKGINIGEISSLIDKVLSIPQKKLDSLSTLAASASTLLDSMNPVIKMLSTSGIFDKLEPITKNVATITSNIKSIDKSKLIPSMVESAMILKILSNATSLVNSANTLVKTIGANKGIITKIIDKFSDLSKPAEDGKKSSIMEAVDSLNKFDITKVIPKELKLEFNLPDFGSIFANSIISALPRVRDGIIQMFQTIDIKFDLLSRKLEVKKKTFGPENRFQAAAAVAAEENKKTVTAGVNTQIVTANEGLQKEVSSLKQMNDLLKGKIAKLTERSKVVKGIDATTGAPSPKEVLEDKLTQAINKQTKAVEARTSAISGLQKTVKDMVAEYNVIATALNDTTPINLVKKIGAFASGLSIENQVFKIESKPVNITINLKTVLDAGTLSKVLTDKVQMAPTGGPTLQAATSE